MCVLHPDFFGKCVEWRALLAAHLKILKDEAHEGELAAFASYAIAFPDGFLALVDTYDVTRYLLYSAIHPLCRNVLKMRIWGISPAGGPIL